MKSRKFRTLVIMAALVAVAAFVSSCNKGYGCPSEFSVGMSASAAVSQAQC